MKNAELVVLSIMTCGPTMSLLPINLNHWVQFLLHGIRYARNRFFAAWDTIRKKSIPRNNNFRAHTCVIWYVALIRTCKRGSYIYMTQMNQKILCLMVVDQRTVIVDLRT